MLTELIIEICECERRTETVRKLLSQLSQFEPYAGNLFYQVRAFKRMDKSRCGEISYQDIIDFMLDNNCSLTSLEASYLLQYLDFNRDGRVTYTDFAKQILPKTDLILKETAAARDSYFVLANKTLPNEVEWGLYKILHQELSNFKHLKVIKELCKESAQQTFQMIDHYQLGYFTAQHLENYFKTNFIQYDKQDISAFFHASDRDEDNKISIVEFNYVIKPFHPSQILKDRERAFYSTPKKYRRIDNSPKPQNSFTNVRSKQFIYKTPVKADLSQPDLEIQKQQLIQQSDFNLIDLFYQQPKATPEMKFRKFCKTILPKNAPPNYQSKPISAKTYQMMLNILRQ
ncbi:unnamed protein product [Paramecium sonneborni]|uniref:EF-hand domain-containing protein n=1 Tax=Paramecium sonneborni TaxID=65129 RepID=A0A8S1MMP8_9CILI|nr:unnamed protein product [Paramecium sonneborni]